MKSTSARYVDVTNEATAQLMRVFGCTDKMVYLALTYRKDSELARKIRYTAVKNYGGKPMAHSPQCETMHNTTADGRQLMVQYFDNGAVLEADKGTGQVIVTNRRGEEVGRWAHVDLPKLAEIQLYAESL